MPLGFRDACAEADGKTCCLCCTAIVAAQYEMHLAPADWPLWAMLLFFQDACAKVMKMVSPSVLNSICGCLSADALGSCRVAHAVAEVAVWFVSDVLGRWPFKQLEH